MRFCFPSGAVLLLLLFGFSSDRHALAGGQPRPQPGQVVISEFRLAGPGRAEQGTQQRDDFIELFNPTGTGFDLSGLKIVTNDEAFGGLVFFEIPLDSIIPPRGYFLIGDSAGYSLEAATPLDVSTISDFDGDFFIENQGIGLFLPGPPAVKIDAVGFTGNLEDDEAILVEGTPLGEIQSAPDMQYSFVRQVVNGVPQDTNDNAADFVIVSVTGTGVSSANLPTMLGAPGPQNVNSPVARTFGAIRTALFDPTVSRDLPPNRERIGSGNSGTLEIRRRFINNGSAPVTRLRFRVIDITTDGTPNATPGQQQAILRAISSDAVTINGQPVRSLTLEQPPSQPIGGGVNSSLAVGTITSATPLSIGETALINFTLNVVQGGNFRFVILIEVL